MPAIDTAGRTTHVIRVRESGLPGQHKLRRTFATACREAGVDPLAEHLLMNHAAPGGVHYRYVQPSIEWMRSEVEKVGRFLEEKLTGAAPSRFKVLPGRAAGAV